MSPSLCKASPSTAGVTRPCANTTAAKHSPAQVGPVPVQGVTPLSPCQCDIATRPRVPPGPLRDPAGLGATLGGSPTPTGGSGPGGWGEHRGEMFEMWGPDWGGRSGLGGHGSQNGESGTGGGGDGGQERGAGYWVPGRGGGFGGGQVAGCNYGGDIWGVSGGSSRRARPHPGSFPPGPERFPPIPSPGTGSGEGHGRTDPRCCGGDGGTSPEGIPGGTALPAPRRAALTGGGGAGRSRSGAGTERSRAGPRRSLPPRSVTCGGAGRPLRGRWDREPVPGTGTVPGIGHGHRQRTAGHGHRENGTGN